MFGVESVDFSDDKNISVTVDEKTVLVSLETRVKASKDAQSLTVQSTSCWIQSLTYFTLSSRRTTRTRA